MRLGYTVQNKQREREREIHTHTAYASSMCAKISIYVSTVAKQKCLLTTEGYIKGKSGGLSKIVALQHAIN